MFFLARREKDLLDGQPVLDVLLRLAQDFEDRLSHYHVILLILPQQGLHVVVVERVDPALAHVMVPPPQGLTEGPLT